MGRIVLLKKKSGNEYIILDKIVVNQRFTNRYDIDFGSTAFFTHFDLYDPKAKKPKVKNLIEWVEEQLKQEIDRDFRFKYEIEPIRFAREKFLPKIKTWDAEMLVDYIEYY